MRLVVCVTGASGAAYVRRALEILSRAALGEFGQEKVPERVDWVFSDNAKFVWATELAADTPPLPDTIDSIAASLERNGSACRFQRWARSNFRAPFASGSNPSDAVIVLPCSMSSLGRFAHGGGTDLIARAGEVALKERRRLILVTRETPLSLVHLRNMCAVTEAGATILPAVPSFYAERENRDDRVSEREERALDSVLARVFDHAGLRLPLLPRWGDEGH